LYKPIVDHESVIVHHASSEPALNADLNGKDELASEFLVTGNASLEDNLGATDAVDKSHDSGHEGPLLPKENRCDAGVKDEQLDELLEHLRNFHLLLLQSLDILERFAFRIL
jgi:hypothetical protein